MEDDDAVEKARPPLLPPAYGSTDHLLDGEKSCVIQTGQADPSSASVTRESEQITFSWENITVQARAKGKDKKAEGAPLFRRKGSFKAMKTILSGASGHLRPGELTAFMGPSGAGKTTLLNALTFRNLGDFDVLSGARYINGVPVVTPDALTAVSAYVQQDDLFLGNLTVKETLQFQAMLRMEKHIPKQHRMERVASVLQELGLIKCQDTLVGVPGKKKGISGGEMKRLAFACEVLTNPPLLFCDEPTSGLDTSMAKKVIEVLRSLSRQGKTIVCTIHQPNSEIYGLFDKVLLMADSRLAYLGLPEGAKQFFTKAGYPCPVNYNPSDHFINTLAVEPGQEEKSTKTISHLCDLFIKSPEGLAIKDQLDYLKGHSKKQQALLFQAKGSVRKESPYRASWWEQYKAVQWRSFLIVSREPALVQVRIFQTIFTSILIGTIFMNQDYLSQRGVQNINGAMYLLLSNVSFQNLYAIIHVFFDEQSVFLREHYSGMYRVDVYYLSKQLAELPTYLAIPVLYSCIYYWLVGFNEELIRFLAFVLVLTLTIQMMASFGYMIAGMSPSRDLAIAVAPTTITPIMVVGGFFAHIDSIPSWLNWLEYLSWFRYGFELMVVNQWTGVTLECGKEDGGGGRHCKYPDGESVIEFYGFSQDNVIFDYAMLASLSVTFRLVGFVALWFRTRRRKAK